MNTPGRLPEDTESAGMEARLRAGLRRAPLPNAVALRLAAAKRCEPSRRGMWLSRILRAATVALCLGLLWHFTSSPARVAPGGEDEKAQPKEKDNGKHDDAEKERVVQRYDLNALLEQARVNEEVMLSLFPERNGPELGFMKHDTSPLTDGQIRLRAASIVKDLLGSRAEVKLDTANGDFSAVATAQTHAEIQGLLAVLRGEFGENRQQFLEKFQSYELDEQQFAKLLPNAKATSVSRTQLLSPDEWNALIKEGERFKILPIGQSQLVALAGKGSIVSVTQEHSCISSYDLSGGVYKPHTRNYLTGSLYWSRVFPDADGSISVQLSLTRVKETGIVTRYFSEKEKESKDEGKVRRLPIQTPQLRVHSMPPTVLRIPAGAAAAIFDKVEIEGDDNAPDPMTRGKKASNQTLFRLTIFSVKAIEPGKNRDQDSPANKETDIEEPLQR